MMKYLASLVLSVCLVSNIYATGALYRYFGDITNVITGLQCISLDGGVTYSEVNGVTLVYGSVFYFLPIDGSPEQDYIYSAIMNIKDNKYVDESNVTWFPGGIYYKNEQYGTIRPGCDNAVTPHICLPITGVYTTIH